MANVPDYWAMSGNRATDKDVKGTLENTSAIDEFRIEEFVRMSRVKMIRLTIPTSIRY